MRRCARRHILTAEAVVGLHDVELSAICILRGAKEGHGSIWIWPILEEGGLARLCLRLLRARM